MLTAQRYERFHIRAGSQQKPVRATLPPVSQRIVAAHVLGWDLALEIKGSQWTQSPLTFHCVSVGLSRTRNAPPLQVADDDS